jgi:hypothetical protein
VSDLETAVHEAVTQVQPLLQALDEAQKECHEAIRYLHNLGERLTADRHALQDVVAALGHDADDTQQMLSNQTADATANLGRVAEAVGVAAGEWNEVFHKEDAALAGGSSLLSELGPRVKDLAETAESASHAALEWANAVSQQLEEAVEAVEQAVSVGLTTMVADWKHQVEVAVTRLVDYFDKDCEGLLNTREADWKSKVEQLHEFMDHAFEGIAPHDHEVASYTVEKWGQLMEVQLASTHKEAQTLNEALASLGQAAANFEGNLQATSDAIGERQQLAAESAARLEQGLFDARGRWGTFGITG